MSHTTPPLRRLLGLLTLVAVMSLPLVPVTSAAADPYTDPAIAQAKAAVVAAKEGVKRAKDEKEDARLDRVTLRDRLARHTGTLRTAKNKAGPVARDLRRSRVRVEKARNAVKNAKTSRVRKAARQRLRVAGSENRKNHAKFVVARRNLLAAKASVARASDAFDRSQTRLAASNVAIAAAEAVLSAAKQHYATLLAEAARDVVTAVANIPNGTSPANFTKSVRRLTASGPDFVTLNEISGRSTEVLISVAPGYGVFRGGEKVTEPGAAIQSISNAVLWRMDRYQPIAEGRIQLVDDDRGFLKGKKFMWDRFATWVTLRNVVDGRLTSVISSHLPTNPGKYPRQWGQPPMTRIELYDLGMNKLVALANGLAQQGRVIVGGDMNSHPNQGTWTAAAKMTAAGYGFTKDRGVMYHFRSNTALVTGTQQIKINSDHPALITAVQYP